MSMLNIVFFPYKASMWDSLESIYNSAIKDEECRVRVVPVPYAEFDKQTGSWRDCCDIDDFPPETVCTRYEDFHIEAEAIDIAYIHYPYDRANRVTRLKEGFNSHELKRYVKKLVYVPYYVTGGSLAWDHRQFPAYYHADMIAVQSADFKEGFKGLPYYDRVQVLGSPKLDKCIEESKKAALSRTSDKGVKTVFLNTSIVVFVNGAEAFLERLRNIFEYFKGRQKLRLWWRPHPLLGATIRSMKPEIRTAFEELVDYYKRENIGVYDDGPDFAGAVAATDAYIGDISSSVINTFWVTGKPIFLFDNFLKHTGENNFVIGDIIKADGGYRVLCALGDIYFEAEAVRDFSSLSEPKRLTAPAMRKPLSILAGDLEFSVNPDSNVLSVRDMQSGEIYEFPVGPDSFGYCGIAMDDSFIYLAETHTGNILRWDMDGGISRIYQMPEGFQLLKDESHPDVAHAGMVLYRDKIYTFPACSNMAVVCDVNSSEARELELYYVSDAMEKIKAGEKNPFSSEKQPVITGFCKRLEDRVFLQSGWDMRLYVFSLERESCIEDVLPGADYGSWSGFCRPDRLYPYACYEREGYPVEGFLRLLCEENMSVVREEQLAEAESVAVNLDGTAGEKIHLAAKQLL